MAAVAEISASTSICNRRRSYNIRELVVIPERGRTGLRRLRRMRCLCCSGKAKD